MRIGGPVLAEIEDPIRLANEHRNLGFRAAFCPFDLSVHDTARVREFRKAFEDQDVVIAEVGAWCNPLDPRDDFAEISINYIMERLALADELGALCCVNIVGSYSTELWYAPDPRNYSEEAFNRTVATTRRIVDAVKPKRAKFTFEITPNNFLDGPENYLKLMKAIDRKEVAVHLDFTNCINSPRTYYGHVTLIEQCCEWLGPHIISCHVKDILIRPEPLSVQFDEVRPGLGYIDYRALLKCAASLSDDVPLMMEHLSSQEEYALAREYIAKVAGDMGISL